FMLIPLDKPLDLASTLESGQAHRWQREGQWYYAVIFNNLVQIRQDPLGLEFYCSPESEERLSPLLKDYLRLEDNLDEIYRQIGKDQHIAQAIAKYRGMRLLRQDPWECLISFICSANSNIPRIAATMEIISEHLGHPLTLNDHIRYTFPTPHSLAEAGEQRLRELRLGFRAKYVAHAAKVVAEGRVDLLALRKVPYKEAKEVLMSFPGIGEKVADCVLAFSLDKMEAFPIDRWVRRALAEWYLDDKRLSYPKLQEWAVEYFGHYASYAQQYLFHERRLQDKP
ncbi:MAG: DNA-3-methyladenine glycosylase 2 family protein, partial [Chloroflexi bacterium]|nr:DNA-3-methyladenine glycosylase 2 family protein [Chloroflexota bacterium]